MQRGAMVLAILSDTHIPGQAKDIPKEFRECIEEADHVIHAGDFGSTQAFEDMRERSDTLTSVYGNADPANIDLPPVASLTIDDVTIVVSHGMINFVEQAVSSSAGVVFNRDDWLDAVADTARARADTNESVIGIGGHTHQVKDEIHQGIRVLNPGSATGVGPAEGRATMLTAEVSPGEVSVTVHESE